MKARNEKPEKKNSFLILIYFDSLKRKKEKLDKKKNKKEKTNKKKKKRKTNKEKKKKTKKNKETANPFLSGANPQPHLQYAIENNLSSIVFLLLEAGANAALLPPSTNISPEIQKEIVWKTRIKEKSSRKEKKKGKRERNERKERNKGKEERNKKRCKCCFASAFDQYFT